MGRFGLILPRERRPRPSLEELYGTHGSYVRRIGEVARELEAERFLLREDVARIIQEAARSEVLKGTN